MKTHRFKFSIIICLVVAFYAAMLTSPALGTPIHYTVQFTVSEPENPNVDPMGLEGSQFTLEYEWDASSLTPTSDEPIPDPNGANRATVWPATNTIYQLTITGSTGSGVDGTYASTTSGALWQLRDNWTGYGDTVQYPIVSFNLPGYRIDISGLNTILPAFFNTPAFPGTVFPFPFQASDVTSWQSPTISYEGNGGLDEHRGESVSGSAAVVPLPGALLLLGTGLLRLAAYGRWKVSRS